MKRFRDNAGRTWNVCLNVHAVKRVRTALGVDLMNAVTVGRDGVMHADVLDRIAEDPCQLVDVLWLLCERQARDDGVTEEDFGTAMAGDAVEEATRAFLDELVDFFPGARRVFLSKVLELSRKYAGEAERKLAEAMEGEDFEERVLAGIALSGSSPERSE